MSFVRRFLEFPTVERLVEIEAINIIDQTPPAPITGIGTGTLLLVGEFEDGPFAVKGGDADLFDPALRNRGIQESFGAEDQRQKFGGFGYTYGTTQFQNPSARRHLAEFWNGSGFVKLKYLQPRRLIVARVDTSVGNVAFSPLGVVEGTVLTPISLAVGDTISLTTPTGGPVASTAIAATRGTITGVAGTFPTLFVGGETITAQVDGGPIVPIVFSAADQTAAQVAARINATLGYTAATVALGQLVLVGIVFGTGGSVNLANVTPGVLATLGLAAAGIGTGNVANLAAVTAAELAAIINGTAGLVAINVFARATSDGRLRIGDDTPGTGSITVVAGPIAVALGFTLGVAVAAGVHGAGRIPAGTRVRTVGGVEWVTMQTLQIAEGTTAAPVGGPFVVKVRPALDDGTTALAAPGAVVVVVDQPTFGDLAVTNPAALTAALTETQMDVVYEAAFDASLDLTTPAREANLSLSARRSTVVVRKGRQNAIDASAGGHFGRIFHTGAPIGFTQGQAQTDVALWRSDRLFYTWPGWRVRLPEIAFIGTAGGLGFTLDGVITVRADGPLSSINAQLAPEENPGQQTDLIEDFFEVEPTSAPLGIQAYTSLKAAGICAPRRDRVAGSIYQSGVTSDLTPGRKTQARRKMADFIQDTLAEALIPFSKKLSTQSRRDGARGVIDTFMGGLLSLDQPERQRIADYGVDAVSGNTRAQEALGIVVFIVQAQTLPSLDAIVVQTEIGEGVVVVTES